MPAEDNDASYALNPFTLLFLDPLLESEYQRYQPVMLVRPLRLLFVALISFFAAITIADYLAAVDDLMLIPWQAGVVLVSAFAGLLILMCLRVTQRWVQLALAATIVLFGAFLLLQVSTSEELMSYFPGFLVMMMMNHFVGLRFIYALTTALFLLAILFGVMITNDIGLHVFLKLCVFLVPGYLLAVTAGYVIEKQRRQLYAQIKAMAQERREHEKMALHDSLTGLPNRNLLKEKTAQSIARAKRQHDQFAVLFVDLDNFKSVNDTYGHSIGDQVLKQLAMKLQDQVRGEDTVARLGGDEFVVLSEQVIDERSAQVAANRIQDGVSNPIVVNLEGRSDEVHIRISCSIGISLYPRDGDSLDTLIAHADKAMYRAKGEGKARTRVFRPEAKTLTDVKSPPS